jgi:hypothetical protein
MLPILKWKDKALLAFELGIERIDELEFEKSGIPEERSIVVSSPHSSSDA